MESLSPELVLQIFDHVQELPTLSALVHASPSFHKVYAAHRAEIFTAFTFRFLEARGIRFTGPPISWVEVRCTKLSFSSPPPRVNPASLQAVLKKINLQLENKRGSRISLTVDDCLILKEIRHIIVYFADKEKYTFKTGFTRMEMPYYPKMTAPDMWSVWDTPSRGYRFRDYPGDLWKYDLLIVDDDLLPEQRHEINQRVAARKSYMRT
ncbi:MAG: hypothetical protein HETSPECPRED_010244 [Heterodermia speciosa]|uniref:Uncharacterized protein n=1 Tax=Heterodermia speciosa TaxID=116794 RepID=A0A8H3ESQ1_9LECA|nr:MAG: hypothetical protein HETSPECPRED_010244 [Heterodermia speciosa]